MPKQQEILPMAKCDRCKEPLHDFQWGIVPHKGNIVLWCLSCLFKEKFPGQHESFINSAKDES